MTEEDKISCWEALRDGSGLLPCDEALVRSLDAALHERVSVANCMSPDSSIDGSEATTLYPGVFRIEPFFHFRKKIDELCDWYAKEPPAWDPAGQTPAVLPQFWPDVQSIEAELGADLPVSPRDDSSTCLRFKPVTPLFWRDMRTIQQALEKLTVVRSSFRAGHTSYWNAAIKLPKAMDCRFTLFLFYNEYVSYELGHAHYQISFQCDLHGVTEYEVPSFEELKALRPPLFLEYAHSMASYCNAVAYADFSVNNGFVYKGV